MPKKVLLSGDRPTGRLHLGHWVGSLKTRKELMDDYYCVFLIADLQACTDNYANTAMLKENIQNIVLDYLSLGFLYSDNCKIVLQSQIPQIAELTGLFMNLVTQAQLERNPTVKRETEERFQGNAPMGFFTYPVSQAADIAVFGTHVVPVGEDQSPMIELTRDIVRKFNHLYGETLVMPEPIYTEQGRLVGTDGAKKMGKSAGNAIYLSDSADEVRSKVMSMFTDPNRITGKEPGNVENNPVFTYLDAFHPDSSRVEYFKELYRAGGANEKGKPILGDVAVKRELIECLNAFLDPIRAQRQRFVPEVRYYSYDVTRMSRDSVLPKVQATMGSVRKAMNLDYFGR